MAMATPCCSSPPWPASSSLSTRRGSNSSVFLPHTATTTRPAASSTNKNAPRRLGALPETALVAAGVAAAVGIAAAVLVRGDGKEQATDREQDDEKKAVEEEEACGACGGTGLCPRCKGEGFVFKEVGEEAAGRARRAAKNMATRYTAGLPTKWTYCNKCSSTRSCTACDGTGTTVVVSPAKSKATTTNSVQFCSLFYASVHDNLCSRRSALGVLPLRFMASPRQGVIRCLLSPEGRCCFRRAGGH